MYPYQYDPRFQNFFHLEEVKGFHRFHLEEAKDFRHRHLEEEAKDFHRHHLEEGAKGFPRREERSRLQVHRQLLHLHQS
ncbi:hypothetical protein LAV82_01760 [Bacillus sp. ILBB4]|nr:hypothetical protein [Bacillus sp. ILBB4]